MLTAKNELTTSCDCESLLLTNPEIDQHFGFCGTAKPNSMYSADLNDKNLNRIVVDFSNWDELDPDVELEYSCDLENLIQHSLNGIQPTVGHGTSAERIVPQQTLKGYEQNCDSPGILVKGRLLPVDHNDLAPSITDLNPSWFHPDYKNSAAYMTKLLSDPEPASSWHEPRTLKLEDLDGSGGRSPCQTVPSLSRPLPPHTPIYSLPSSPHSRHGSFSSQLNIPTSNIPTSVIKAESGFLEIPRQKPGRKPSGKPNSNHRKRHVEKGTQEYVDKRVRNNVAVRKSREKAKQKQQTTESRVTVLQQDNRNLVKKVELLTKELSVLRGLFVNVGATLPENLDELLSN